MDYGLQQTAHALFLGTSYAALAAAYALPFGLTRRPDFSFGAVIAFAGQIFVVMAVIAWNGWWLVLPLALAIAAAVSLASGALAVDLVGRRVFLPLSAASPNTWLVASLGTMLVLMELARLAVRNKAFWLPPFGQGRVTLCCGQGGPGLTVTQLGVMAGSLLIVAFAVNLTSRGRFAREWCSVRDDPSAAALCGVDVSRVRRIAFLVGAMLGMAGGLLQTVWLGTMDYGAAVTLGLKIVFIAAVGGPLGPGHAAGFAALLGMAEVGWSAVAPIAWRDIVIFGAMVLVVTLWRTDDHRA